MSLNPGVTKGRKIYDENGNSPYDKGLPRPKPDGTGIPTFCIAKDSKGNCIYASRWFWCTNNEGKFIEDANRLDSALKKLTD
jgi:hypothetical protein